jgi:hypothetical protein
MLVAAVAAKRQIVSCRRPTETAWYDVINCEGICRVSGLRAAVFATMLAAISNQAAQISRDCLSDMFGKMDPELIHQHR